MNSYEINEDTLAIVPQNEKKSMVYEKNNTFLVSRAADKIMEDSCEYYGSSLKGRQKGSSNLLHLNHKLPIIVEETNKLVYFPTASPRSNNCSWINLNNILKYERYEKGCRIIFKDNVIVELPISYGMINNQILRSSRLSLIYDERIKEKSKKNEKNTKKNIKNVL